MHPGYEEYYDGNAMFHHIPSIADAAKRHEVDLAAARRRTRRLRHQGPLVSQTRRQGKARDDLARVHELLGTLALNLSEVNEISQVAMAGRALQRRIRALTIDQDVDGPK